MSLPAVSLPPKVEQSGNVRVITFTAGEVRDVQNMIARELEGRTYGLDDSHLLLDFNKVEFLTSDDLGTLITLHKRMKASGGRLTLFNLNAQVYEIVTKNHLQTLLGICREEWTNPRGSGYPTMVKNKVDGAEKTATGYPGDPDKYVYSG